MDLDASGGERGVFPIRKGKVRSELLRQPTGAGGGEDRLAEALEDLRDFGEAGAK